MATAKKKTANLEPTLTATPKKKAPAKKAAKKRGGDSTRVQVFKMLAKHPDGLTVADIQKRLELKGKPSFVKHEALRDKPRIKREKHADTRAMLYSLTAAGKAAIEKGTVDSDAAPSSVGAEE